MVSFITALGAIALASGGLSYLSLPAGLKMAIGEFVNLKEGGLVFPAYMNPPFAVDSAFYIYQVVNPKETLAGGKMEVALRGPYKYKTYSRRANIRFSANGEKITFETMRRAWPNEADSRDFNEKFYSINPLVPSIVNSIKSLLLDRIPFQRIAQPIVLNAVNVVLDTYGERLIHKVSPREVLDGKKVGILAAVSGLARRFGFEGLLPPTPPGDIFGIVYLQNVTSDMIEIYTGVGSTKLRFGDVDKWRNKTRIDIWPGKCSLIEGTNGEIFKAFPKVGKPLKVFLGQLCRSIELDPVGGVQTVQDGLDALEYEITPRLYLGSRKNPNNKCYCRNTRTYDCQFDGLISMGPCYLDAPIYFARPNFETVDKRIRRMVKEETIEKDLVPERQSFYLDPVTGSLLKVNLTLAAMVKLVRQPYLRDLARIQNLTYAPFFVVSELAVVPRSLTYPIVGVQAILKNYEPASIVGMLGGSGILVMKFLRRGGGSKAATAATTPEVASPENGDSAISNSSGKNSRTSRNQVQPKVKATESLVDQEQSQADGLAQRVETAAGERGKK